MNSPTLQQIDDALANEKWPRMSPWWQNVFEEVYATICRNIVISGGRRGGKSSNLCGKIAIHEVLSDKHEVPPGDTGYFAILSADKDQAKERLETCHEALKALGIAHRKTATEITLVDRNVGIKAFAATLQAVVSFTCIGFLADEMARWRDKDTGENPAKQIITSLRATMLTMPHARGWYVSAPWSTLDEHHKMVARGNTDAQMVFVGTTPQMNPTLTDEMIAALEPDEPSRLREYYVVPMSADETKFFSAEFIDAATQTKTPIPRHGKQSVAGGDFAFRRNSSALAVLHRIGLQKTILAVDAERVPGLKSLVPSDTINELAELAAEHGAEAIACDLHYIETVREHVEEIDLPLLEFPTENDKIAAAYIRTRVLLSKGLMDLSRASPKLIEQLKNTTVQPTMTGLTIKNKTVDGAHGDIVSALVCGVWALEQPLPEKKMVFGDRRFPRGGAEENPNNTLTDYADDSD